MIWKPIKGFEYDYLISENGDIKNRSTDLILKPWINNKGYKCISLCKDGKSSKFSVHRLVAVNFVDNPNNYPIVLHIDNNKLNTHYSNLKWGTYSENNAQAIRDGLNKVPRPDNRKYYEIYDPYNIRSRKVCYGAQNVIDTIGFGNESFIRNALFRNTEIKTGEYKGFKIKRIYPIKPVKFNIIKPISFF